MFVDDFFKSSIRNEASMIQHVVETQKQTLGFLYFVCLYCCNFEMEEV